jgi:hypothetical protein
MPTASPNVELHTESYFVSVTSTKHDSFCSGSKYLDIDLLFRMSSLNRIGSHSGRLAGVSASRIWQAISHTISHECGGSMFKVDQIISENKSYIQSMSVMAGKDCSLFGMLDESDSTHFPHKKRLKLILVFLHYFLQLIKVVSGKTELILFFHS